MWKFWKRQDRGSVAALALRVEQLERELTATQSAHRTLETEQIAMHDQVKKWMRRGLASERNQEREAVRETPAPSTDASRPLTGARARIAARRGYLPAELAGPIRSSNVEESNGVPS